MNSQRHFIRVGFFSVLVAFSVNFRVVGEPTTPDFAVQSLKAEIQNARWESRFVQAKGQSRTTFNTNQANEYAETRFYTYKQRETGALMVERLVGKNSEIETVVGSNSRYGFRLKKNKGQAWILDELFLGRPRAATHANQPIDEFVLGQVSLGFSGNLMRAKDLGIRQLSKESGETGLLGFLFEWKVPRAKGTVQAKSRVYFTPTPSFSVARAESTFSQSDSRSRSVSEFVYDGKLGALPRLKQWTVRSESESAKGEKSVALAVHDIDLWLDTEVPETEFTLSAFGLPEPRGVHWPQRSYAWLAYGSIGMFLLMLGFLFRQRLRTWSPGT